MDYQVKFNQSLSLSVQNTGIIAELNEVTHCGMARGEGGVLCLSKWGGEKENMWVSW